MNNEILFTERQKFNQWWLLLILLAINGLLIFGVCKQVLSGHQFGSKPMSNTALLATTAAVIIFTILFISLRLETRIKGDGIYVKFFPLHLLYKHYNFSVISKLFVRQYNPIGEYGGWGFRLAIFGKGRALNMSGNKGLQIVFSDNKKLLIGTNKPEELTQTLQEIGQLKP